MTDKKSSPEWEEGFDAFFAGQSDTANPYDVEADEIKHMDWNDGYAAGQDE